MRGVITKRIASSEFQTLLERAVARYGLPSCYEELAIYIKGKDPNEFTRVIVRSTTDAECTAGNKKKERTATIPFKGADTKKVLSFLALGASLRGVISVSPVYEFKDQTSGESIRLLKTSLQGSIIIFSNKNNENDLGEIILSKDDTPQSARETEIIIDYSISPNGILNTKIQLFLKKMAFPFHSMERFPIGKLWKTVLIITRTTRTFLKQ